MPQPYDYKIDIPNPRRKIMEQLSIKSAEETSRRSRIEFDQKQAAISQATARREKLHYALSELDENSTAEDYLDVFKIGVPKDQADALFKSFDMFNKEQQVNELKSVGEIITALGNDPELGVSLLEERAEALRNSGKENEAKKYESWANLAKEKPKLVKDIMSVTISAIPAGREMLENIFGTRKTAAETEGLLVEAKGAGTELAFKKEHGGLTQKEVYAAEVGIRKEEKWASKTLSEINAQYDKMKSSVGAKTGIGDYAVVVTFIKMLEPDSVVRESEAAAARSAVSAWEQLNQFGAKLKKGETLMPEVRQKFLTLAKEFKEATEAMIVDRKSKYDIEIRDKNLSRERIWGSGFAPTKIKDEEVVLDDDTSYLDKY